MCVVCRLNITHIVNTNKNVCALFYVTHSESVQRGIDAVVATAFQPSSPSSVQRPPDVGELNLAQRFRASCVLFSRAFSL